MPIVNWDKAPKGCTHYSLDPHAGEKHLKAENGMAYWWDRNRWQNYLGHMADPEQNPHFFNSIKRPVEPLDARLAPDPDWGTAPDKATHYSANRKADKKLPWLAKDMFGVAKHGCYGVKQKRWLQVVGPWPADAVEKPKPQVVAPPPAPEPAKVDGIDWANAPEGATHKHPNGYFINANIKSYWSHDGRQRWIQYTDHVFNQRMLTAVPSPAWLAEQQELAGLAPIPELPKPNGNGWFNHVPSKQGNSPVAHPDLRVEFRLRGGFKDEARAGALNWSERGGDTIVNYRLV